MSQLRENTQEFLQAIMLELNEDDAAAMFGFLANTVKGNPGKLKKLAGNLKDPKNLADMEKLMSGKGSMLEKAMRGKKLFDQLFK